ncbi:phosphohistidine phosphatase SixA [Singulisphaera rosea]
MNQLYLLRHGIALPFGTPDIPDDDRPLTPKGERRIKRIGRTLRRLNLDVDRIVTSPLPRAFRTAELVADALGLQGQLETADELRAGRSAEAIRDWVLGRPEDRLMIVGHNPSLSELVGLLVTGQSNSVICELGKGGIAALASQPGAGMRLDWLVQPRLIRRLGKS